MPIGKDHVVCFYQYPKVISLHSGKTVMQWEDIYSGDQKSSILLNSMSLPPLALDPENHRFAVFGPGGIKVIQVDLTE